MIYGLFLKSMTFLHHAFKNIMNTMYNEIF
jgi:hypothetical protein